MRCLIAAVMLAIGVCGAFTGWSVAGQDVDEEDDARMSDLLQPYEYFDTDGVVEAMKAHFRKKNWRRFLDCLSLVMRRALKESGVNEMVERSEKVYMPLLSFCRAMLQSLPPEGLEMYRATYSALAERELQEALKSGDEEAIRRVALMYPLTDAAARALELMADSSLERGDASEAYGYLREAGRSGAVLLKQAAALLVQGAKAEAAAILNAAVKAGAADRFPLALKLLRQALKDVRFSRRVSVVDGANSCTEEPVEKYDLAAVSKMTYKMEDGKRYGVDWDEELSGEKAGRRPQAVIGLWMRPLPGWKVYTGAFRQFVVVVNGKVVTTDGRYVLARKLKGGKLQWRYPEIGGSFEPNVVVRSVACDGQRVYAVIAHSRRVLPSNRRRRGFRVSSASGNDLVALSLKSGRLIWSAYENNTTELSKTVFLTPPIVVGGRIYVGCASASTQIQWDYGVCCFSRSGKLLWISNFAFNKGLYATGGILREYDGDIYYLTNGGLFACVDARSGRVVWVVRYAVAPSERHSARRAYPPVAPLFWKGVWKGRPRRVVVILPSDSDFVSAYDLDAKRLLWREERCGATSALGFFANCVLLTGGTSLFMTGKPAIVGYHVITGKIKLHDEVEHRVQGKGLLTSDGHLLLPCADGLWLLKVQKSKEFKGGYVTKELGFWRWYSDDRVPAAGNLTLYRGRLICANTRHCCVYLLPRR
ncbi:MAG: hypothetical protein DRP82_03765 [Planctomycetota bacterium]|nr:MAG: hypothetical protein DRP82_03765 [Planctomycetota bacterium]